MRRLTWVFAEHRSFCSFFRASAKLYNTSCTYAQKAYVIYYIQIIRPELKCIRFNKIINSEFVEGEACEAAYKIWIYKPEHDKTYKMTCAPSDEWSSLGIRHVLSESLLCFFLKISRLLNISQVYKVNSMRCMNKYYYYYYNYSSDS